MHDIWEPELQARISQFIHRKAKEYPELHLTTDGWEKHEYIGRPRHFTRPRKQLKHA